MRFWSRIARLKSAFFGPGLLPQAETLWIDELAVGTERPAPDKAR